MGAKKNFVLDTNVILHDYKCIENFQENDIYLPIVVLEELDKFKKGSEQINYNAREFVRELDLLTSNDLFLKGASLPCVSCGQQSRPIAYSVPRLR